MTPANNYGAHHVSVRRIAPQALPREYLGWGGGRLCAMRHTRRFSVPACAVRGHLPSTAVCDDNPISYLNTMRKNCTGFSLQLKYRM